MFDNKSLYLQFVLYLNIMMAWVVKFSHCRIERLIIMHGENHGCWSPGGTKNMAFNSHGCPIIDLSFQK